MFNKAHFNMNFFMCFFGGYSCGEPLDKRIKSMGTEKKQKQIFFSPAPFELQLKLRFFVLEAELKLIQVFTEIFTHVMQTERVSQTSRSIYL